MTERTTESILAERAGQHGSFADNANLATELMSLVEDSPNAGAVKADPTIKVGIFMILHKLARALSGDLRYADHWDDIAGYAKLVSKHVSGKEHAGDKTHIASPDRSQDTTIPNEEAQFERDSYDKYVRACLRVGLTPIGKGTWIECGKPTAPMP